MNNDRIIKVLKALDASLEYYAGVLEKTEKIRDNGIDSNCLDVATSATSIIESVKAFKNVLGVYRAFALKQITGQDPISIPVNQPPKPKLILIKGGLK